MAPKPLDFLNRLPSVNELLDRQPVRALTDRWNRSTVAAGVRSFLDELRSDLRRRAAEAPSIRDLAELAARYVVAQQQSIPQNAINATGRIFGSPWYGVPLCDAALERLISTGRDFALSPAVAAGSASASSGDPESLVCRITAAPAAAAVHSYSAALWLALSAVAADREVLISRAEMGEVDPGVALSQLATAARCTLTDVGTANRCSAADFETAASPRVAALLRFCPDNYHIVGETAAAELEELVALARDRELLLISALGAAPLIEPPVGMEWARHSVSAALAMGVDLVIVRGNGLVGGPSCGILAGTHQVIGRIVNHPLYPAMRLDPLQRAALSGTLACYDNMPPDHESVPIFQLLATPLENLKNRAERIAPQIAQAPDVAAAVAVETRSPIAGALLPEGRPSYAVALAPSEGNLDALEQRLLKGDQPVVARREGEQLLLDLYTVIPRQDTLLVQAVARRAAEPDTAANPTNGAPSANPAT